jgi:hypothetical protein
MDPDKFWQSITETPGTGADCTETNGNHFEFRDRLTVD